MKYTAALFLVREKTKKKEKNGNEMALGNVLGFYGFKCPSVFKY